MNESNEQPAAHEPGFPDIPRQRFMVDTVSVQNLNFAVEAMDAQAKYSVVLPAYVPRWEAAQVATAGEATPAPTSLASQAHTTAEFIKETEQLAGAYAANVVADEAQRARDRVAHAYEQSQEVAAPKIQPIVTPITPASILEEGALNPALINHDLDLIFAEMQQEEEQARVQALVSPDQNPLYQQASNDLGMAA